MNGKLETLASEKIIPIIRTDSAETAILSANAAFKGGLNAVELTMTIPGALSCIAEIKKSGAHIVGLGTITDEKSAEAAINAGADFVVSPHLDKSVIKTCLAAGVLVIPGVATPTEIIIALRLGASIVKVFPVNCLGGAEYVKALLGPYPDLKIFATGGITDENIAGYLKAGAVCAGIGGALFNNTWIKNEDFQKITEKAEFLASVRDSLK